MLESIKRRCRSLASCFDLWRYRATYRAQRLSRAWSYFTERLTADDAQRIVLDCYSPAGWHPLLVLTVEDTLEQARETLADHPDLPRLIADGCARVGNKWESYNDDLYIARSWAIEVAEGYAADEGITLIRLSEGVAEGDAPASNAADGGAS
jgi:hypothetical protein